MVDYPYHSGGIVRGPEFGVPAILSHSCSCHPIRLRPTSAAAVPPVPGTTIVVNVSNEYAAPKDELLSGMIRRMIRGATQP